MIWVVTWGVRIMLRIIGKSKRLPNFKGCLIWTIAFHKKIDEQNIKLAFQKLMLNFNLVVIK